MKYAEAAAAHIARAALIGMCSSVIPCSPNVCCVFTAHAALVTRRLGGVDDGAVGLCINVISDLQ